MAVDEHAHELPLVRRIAEGIVLACVLSVAYFGAGSRVLPSPEPIVTALDGRIPFTPAAVWVYLPGYISSFLVAIWAVRDARRFRAALTALGMLTVLALPFFVLFPVLGPRPPAPEGHTATDWLVRWLYAHDPNVNTFPSLHVANATLCALITSACSRRWGVVSWLLALGVAISVVTLKQHWVVDVPAGWTLAAVGVGTWRAQLLAPSLLATLPRRLSGFQAPAPLRPLLNRVRINARRRA